MRELNGFKAQLNGCLEIGDNHLQLTQADNAKLLSNIPENDFAFLTVEGPHWREEIAVTNECGTLLISRGVNGTEPRKFPRGSCLKYEVSTSVVKWLICNHDCCAAGDCPTAAPVVTGATIPNGRVGVPWQGSIVFEGTLPMAIGVSPLPSWVTADVGVNYVFLKGTPPAVQSATVGASATNRAGEVTHASYNFQVVAA